MMSFAAGLQQSGCTTESALGTLSDSKDCLGSGQEERESCVGPLNRTTERGAGRAGDALREALSIEGGIWKRTRGIRIFKEGYLYEDRRTPVLLLSFSFGFQKAKLQPSS